jgi:hypothetical protein
MKILAGSSELQDESCIVIKVLVAHPTDSELGQRHRIDSDTIVAMEESDQTTDDIITI